MADSQDEACVNAAENLEDLQDAQIASTMEKKLEGVNMCKQ